MNNHAIFCSIVVLGMAATGAAQTAPAPETWVPASRMTQAVTGRVTFTTLEITFQNGKSLSLAPGGQMIFRADKKQKVMADLYRVTQPEDPALENGSMICKGKGIAYLLVWKSQRIGSESDPRAMAAFSGKSFALGSHDECGRFVYDAGAH